MRTRASFCQAFHQGIIPGILGRLRFGCGASCKPQAVLEQTAHHPAQMVDEINYFHDTANL
jgi:hypothetical protein